MLGLSGEVALLVCEILSWAFCVRPWDEMTMLNVCRMWSQDISLVTLY